MHPLAPDLSGLTESELQTKHGELIQRLTQASRIGPFSIISQIQMILDDYQREIQVRNHKILEDMASKTKSTLSVIDIK